MNAAHKELVEVEEPGDATGHILAGDIMSPGTTQQIAAHIVRFIQRQAR